MKMALVICGAVILILIAVLSWMSYPWSLGQQSSQGEVVVVEPVVDSSPWSEESPSVIKVLTWNLGFLYGQGSEGPGYERKSREFFEARLKTLVKEIRDWGPDILFLQEIDFDSSRSAGINQARYLAVNAGYPYVAEVHSWRANYIPFPYWPLSRHFGGMDSGGAVLSRFPITDHQFELLKKPGSNPWWYNLFYLHRYFQKVSIDIGGKAYQFVNLHLEAFDKETRAQEAALLVRKIQNEKIDFVMGDFNMVPDLAQKKRHFPGSEDDYENDRTFKTVHSSGLSEVIPDSIYGKSESRFFTFPAWKPDRRLDYIFFEKGLKMIRAEVLPSALSDHLPLRASFQLSGPNFNPYQL